MSSQCDEMLGDILSDNVLELLNGEICNVTRKSRKLKWNRFNSMNSDEGPSSLVNKNFSSLQNISLNSGNETSSHAEVLKVSDAAYNLITENVDQSGATENNRNTNQSCDRVISQSCDITSNISQPCDKGTPLNASSDGSAINDDNDEDKLKSVDDELEEMRNLLKEKDRQLQIAAQYGIKLVNRSQELELQLEREKDNLKIKLEEASNERHQLKRQLERQAAEHEIIIIDLKSDLAAIKRSLDEEIRSGKSMEKEYKEKVQELTICNEVLSEQILSASIHEEEARSQVCNLRLQVSECELEQCDQVQDLQNELAEVKNEMERMIKLKADECRILSSDLDTSQEQLTVLEKERASEAFRAHQLQEEFLKLEDKYVILLSKIESPTQSVNSFNSTNPNEMSLFAELDVLSDAALTFDILSGKYNHNGRSIIGTQLRQEILEVYRQVQRLIMEVKGQGNLWSPEVVDIADLKAGQLLLALSELQDLMSRRFRTTTLPPLNDERSRLEGQVSYLKEQSNTLREQLNTNQMALDSVKAELAQRNGQLRRSSEEKAELEKTISELRQEVMDLHRNLDERREIKAGICKDDVMKELQQERDEAMKSKQLLQDQIIQLQLDLNSLDHQLIESVQQKLQLSNQLEAWQNDMHDLIENKMAGEIARDSMKGHKRSTTSPVSSQFPTRPSYLKKFTLRWS